MSDIWKDLDIRITDQRIGMGVGGFDTILRMTHLPTGIVVEIPRQSRSHHRVREVAKEMIEYALTEFQP
jgi:protein subunit release factor A